MKIHSSLTQLLALGVIPTNAVASPLNSWLRPNRNKNNKNNNKVTHTTSQNQRSLYDDDTVLMTTGNSITKRISNGERLFVTGYDKAVYLEQEPNGNLKLVGGGVILWETDETGGSPDSVTVLQNDCNLATYDGAEISANKLYGCSGGSSGCATGGPDCFVALEGDCDDLSLAIYSGTPGAPGPQTWSLDLGDTSSVCASPGDAEQGLTGDDTPPVSSGAFGTFTVGDPPPGFGGTGGTPTGGMPPPPTPRPGASPGSTLPPGCVADPIELASTNTYVIMETTVDATKQITNGEKITAVGSGGFYMEQEDCMLYVKDPDGNVLWSKGDETGEGCYTNLQGDCHLLIRDEDGGKRWGCHAASEDPYCTVIPGGGRDCRVAIEGDCNDLALKIQGLDDNDQWTELWDQPLEYDCCSELPDVSEPAGSCSNPISGERYVFMNTEDSDLKYLDESETQEDSDLVGWQLTQDECELKLTSADGQVLFSRGQSDEHDTCYTNLQKDCHLRIQIGEQGDGVDLGKTWGCQEEGKNEGDADDKCDVVPGGGAQCMLVVEGDCDDLKLKIYSWTGTDVNNPTTLTETYDIDLDYTCCTEPPTPSPTASPTPSPTSSPTPSPTSNPTPSPTSNPTPSPTPAPTCVDTGDFCSGTDASDTCCEDGA
eukprot:CAMPEP_0195281684 /NCGR_PEP_ID=MMETSP0707-20130614/893_1 /TAXON_ID=33640 /ORGANISM="Asterionellopsis glacialis, Strain CCMP134" /LENGTH=654 /DNA_ID=CAMNT_0040340595 /DNA_START=292 /DNA_END=2252 /DNA_ORIENTATION=+